MRKDKAYFWTYIYFTFSSARASTRQSFFFCNASNSVGFFSVDKSSFFRRAIAERISDLSAI